MLAPIEFDDEPRPHTGKIADVWPNGALASEAEVAELIPPEVVP